MTIQDPPLISPDIAESVDEGAFPRLSAAHLDRLRQVGEVRETTAGQVLFRDGDRSPDFFVIESGDVAIVRGYGFANEVISLHGAGRFLGEISLITGSAAYLSAVVRTPGTVIAIALDDFRRLLADDGPLADIVLSAFFARRALHISQHVGPRLIGSKFAADTRRIGEFLTRNRIPFHWVDPDSDPDAEALLCEAAVDPSEMPLVCVGTGLLRNPSNAEIGELLGLGARGTPPPMCDLVIVGGGPAGLAAAVYGASEGLDTQLLDTIALGGQASTSSRIENYLGFPAGISGSELAERARVQAGKFKARMVFPADARSFAARGDHFEIGLDNGDLVHSRSVIIATGARYRTLPLPRYEEFEDVNIFYAATTVESQRVAGKPVIIVGGGNSAGQAALFLCRHAISCKLVIRAADLTQSMSRYLIDEIDRCGDVELVTRTEVVELHGGELLSSVTLAHRDTGAREEVPVGGLFVFIGAEPHTDWLGGALATDEHGFILAGRDLVGEQLSAYGDSEQPQFLETSLPGVFAVGDVRSGSVKRVASAVGDGSVAVRLVHERLANPILPAFAGVTAG